MFSKITKVEGFTVLACCDEELIGRVLTEKQFNVDVKESFYKGTRVSEPQLAQLLREADNINLLGEKSVGTAVKEGFITQGNIIRIAGVPHAQIYKLNK